MEAQNIINSLNTVSEKFFESIEGEVYTFIDKLIDITPDMFDKPPLKNLFFQSGVNGFILIANSLILFYIIYFIISKLISIYNGNKTASIYTFVIRLVIVTAFVNSSYYICKEIINLNNLLGVAINDFINSVSGKYATFENLKENILSIEDLMKTDFLSLNGIIKGIISFGSISVLINFSIRYVTIIILFMISPFCFGCLSSELTIGIFKAWIKMFITTLLTQIIVKFVIFIPIIYKSVNSQFYKIILVGSIYVLYKINNISRELFTKITSDIPKMNIFNG